MVNAELDEALEDVIAEEESSCHLPPIQANEILESVLCPENEAESADE